MRLGFYITLIPTPDKEITRGKKNKTTTAVLLYKILVKLTLYKYDKSSWPNGEM